MLSPRYPTSVAYTLTPPNNSLTQGNFHPPSPGQLEGAVYDPYDREVFVGDYAGSSIFGLNASTGELQDAISTGGGGPIALALLTAPTRIVTADEPSGAISIIDPGNQTLIQKIRVGQAPDALAVDQANHTLYIADFNNGDVIALNTSTYRVTANISVGAGPDALAFDSKDQLLFVANYDYFSLTIIDTVSNSIVVHQLKLGTGQPYCLVYDPLNGYIYSGNQGAGNVSVIAAANHSFVGSGVRVGGDCLAMTYDSMNGNVYVGNAGPGIVAINGTTLNGSGVTDPYTPEGLAFDIVDNRIYVANYGTNTVMAFSGVDSSIVVRDEPLAFPFLQASYSPATGDAYLAAPDPGFLCFTGGSVTVLGAGVRPAVLHRIPVGLGPEATVVDPRSGFLFVANFCSNNVTVVNLTTDLPVVPGGVPVGHGPIALGYDPLTDRVLVANGRSANLTVINGSSGLITNANVSVGTQPDAIAVDPANGQIYVANYGSDNLTVLNGTSFQPAHSPIPVGLCPEGLVYDPTGDRIVSLNSCSNNLTVLNGSTGATLKTGVPAGGGPVAGALDPSFDLLYLADAWAGTVAVVNLSTYLQPIPPIPVNGDPQGIVFVPASNAVDVSDFGSGTVSIIATVPVVGSFLASASTVETHALTSLFVSASEPGAPTLTVAYAGLPPGCASRDAFTLSCVPTAPGTYRVVVTVTDPTGYSGWSTLTLTVVNGLLADSLTVAPGRIDLGQTVTLVTATEAGIGGLTYTYSGLPAGCRSTNNSTVSCRPTEPGLFLISVRVTDAAGATVGLAAVLEVAGPLALTSLTANPPTGVLGTTFTLLGSVAEGTPPLAFQYSGLPPGCGSADTPYFACTPNATGEFVIHLAVTDAAGETAYASAPLAVTQVAPPPLEILRLLAEPAITSVGANLTLEAVVGGGTTPYEFSYAGLPAGCASVDAAQLVCRPTAVGWFNVTLSLTDAKNGSTVARTTVEVTASPRGPSPGSLGAPIWPSGSFAWALLGGCVLGGLLLGLVTARILRQRGPRMPRGEAQHGGV